MNGDVFMWWLSAQPDRAASVTRCRKAIEACDRRDGLVELNSRQLLSSLRRSGHVEYAGRRITATTPTLVANLVSLVADQPEAEWIGARCQKTIKRMTSAYNLKLRSELSRENYTRWFLSGTKQDLSEGIGSLGGTIQFSPGSRILAALPSLSAKFSCGGSESPPHDETVCAMRFQDGRQWHSWRRVNLDASLPTGLYRIGNPPYRWTWHQQGSWERLEGEQRLCAAWLNVSQCGRARMQFQLDTKKVAIDRIGLPLPVLCDRALQLGGGPPEWTHESIVYSNVEASEVAHLQRILHLQTSVTSVTASERSDA